MNTRCLLISFVCIVLATGSDSTKAQTWQPMDSGTTMYLSDVWGSGPDNVFAVGQAGTILRYNGLNWAPMSSPTGTQLRGITGWSQASAVAVGRDKTILRYDGTSWSLVGGVPGNPYDAYYDVWGTGPDNFFMAGDEDIGAGAHGLILHWDGISWDRRAIDPPSGAYSMALTSVWGQGPDDVYVGGCRYGGEPRALLYHFDGANWTPDTSLPIGMVIISMWGEGSNLFMVGAGTGYPNQPVMMWRLGASGWQTHTMSMGWDPTLWDVWGSASNDVYAVGYYGAIVHYDGNGAFEWTLEEPLSPRTTTYFGIWGSSARDIFVVGSGGTILHRHVNGPPVAVCQNVTVEAGLGCVAGADIDNGSYDPDGDAITTTQSPSGPYPLGDTLVTLTVTDSHSSSDSCTATVTVVDKTQPVIAAAIVSPQVVEIGQTVNFDAVAYDECDPTAQAQWDFGDGVVSSGTVAVHAYSAAGIYTATLGVTDASGNSATEEFFVVVYDPSAGFVTGGGWIWSPEGAFADDPLATGKANFGFVSKYKKGATVPTGQTEFVFQAGDLNFYSSSYEWLVVTGSNYARFKGIGTINGSGTYKFMLWARDDAPDTFRIRIWLEEGETENVVYDNGMDQPIGGGSIVVHTN